MQYIYCKYIDNINLISFSSSWNMVSIQSKLWKGNHSYHCCYKLAGLVRWFGVCMRVFVSVSVFVCMCVCVCVCLCDVMLWSVLDGGVMGRAWGGFFSPTLPWVNRCYRYQHCHGFSFAPGTHLTWDYFSHIWVLSQCVHRDKTLHCHFTICFDLGYLISTGW